MILWEIIKDDEHIVYGIQDDGCGVWDNLYLLLIDDRLDVAQRSIDIVNLCL